MILEIAFFVVVLLIIGVAFLIPFD